MSANEIMEFKDTELTLGLPGTTSDYDHHRVFGVSNFKISSTSNSSSSSMKRGFMETVDQIGPPEKLYRQLSTWQFIIRARIIGWPPVRSMRQKALVVVESSRKNVKESADGAPYLRKLDLEVYKGYQELLRALDQMFTFLTICRKCIEDSNEVMKPALKGMDQYVLTYEDKDGDWMLVGDVPWKMFIESYKRTLDEKFRCCWDSSKDSDSFVTMDTNSTAHYVHIDGIQIPSSEPTDCIIRIV